MDHKNVSRGLGNQVTVEFNLLYRFHCAISQRDEKYTEDFMREAFDEAKAKAKEQAKKEGKPEPEIPGSKDINVKDLSMPLFGALAKQLKDGESGKDPWLVEFGLKNASDRSFKRNTITGLFDDKQMIEQLKESMDDPICTSSLHALVAMVLTNDNQPTSDHRTPLGALRMWRSWASCRHANGEHIFENLWTRY